MKGGYMDIEKLSEIERSHVINFRSYSNAKDGVGCHVEAFDFDCGCHYNPLTGLQPCVYRQRGQYQHEQYQYCTCPY